MEPQNKIIINNIFEQKIKAQKFSIYKVYKYDDKNNTKKNPNPANTYTNTINNICKEITISDASYHFLINPDCNYVLYADIDGYDKDINLLFNDVITFLKQFYGIATTPSDFFYTTNNGKNGSYHITNNKLYCKAKVQKEIFNNFLLNYPSYITKNKTVHRIIDTTVYGISWYRCANQTKGNGDKNKHLPSIGTYADTIIFNIPKDSKDINNITPLAKINVIEPFKKDKKIDMRDLNILPLKEDNNVVSSIDVKQKCDKFTLYRDKEITVLKLLIDTCLKQYRFDDYNEWIHIGFSIKNSLGQDGYNLFHYYSSKSKKYDKNEADKVWGSLLNSSATKPITIASLYYYAKNDNRVDYDIIIKTKSMFSNMTISEHDVAEYIKYFKGIDFVWQKGIMYAFNGKQWAYDENSKEDYASKAIRNYIMTDIYVYLIDIMPPCIEDRKDAESRRRSINQLKKMQFKNNVVATSKDLLINNTINFDNNQYLLPFDNVVCDLRTNIFRPYERRDYVTKYISYDWREPTQKELDIVNNLIIQIMPNKEERDLYLTILATCLDANNKPFFAMFQASGRNGKSLINDFLRYALTDTLTIKANSALLFQPSASGSIPEIANLGNKRMVLFQELDDSKGNKLNNTFLKNATGGSEWTGRQCYSNVTTHKNCSTVIIECNEKLQFQTPPDTAERDRLVYIFFPSYFTINKSDVNESKNIYLADEYYKSIEFKEKHKYALIRILLDMYSIYVENGSKLVIPDFIKNRADDFLQNSSGIMGWFKECYEEVKDSDEIIFSELSVLYSNFQLSDFYKNMDRKEKQCFNKNKFYSFFRDNCFLKDNYRFEKMINKVKYKNIILNWKYYNSC